MGTFFRHFSRETDSGTVLARGAFRFDDFHCAQEFIQKVGFGIQGRPQTRSSEVITMPEPVWDEGDDLRTQRG